MSSADSVLLAAAEGLAGARVQRLERCETGTGGNNRVFRLTTERGIFALKSYRQSRKDPRDRLGVEFAGLRYASAVAPGRVPEAIAADAQRGLALYEWIDGEPVTEYGNAEIAEAVDFVTALHRGRNAPSAQEFGSASEAILTPDDLREQIERRLRALRGVRDSPALETVLERLWPLYDRHVPRLSPFASLSTAQRTLSPSDFGFHNALRRQGRLVFLDFEYFGWDDPVKLVCDFLWHPAMRLGPPQRQEFFAGALRLYAEDGAFLTRLRAYEPLIAIRWAAIVLGEFLPEVRKRRRYAGRDLDRRRDEILGAQVAKANAILDRLVGELAA